MFGQRRSAIRIAALMLAAALAAGCTGTRSGQTAAPDITPIGAMVLRAAPVKGDKAHFAFATVDGAPIAILREMSTALNRAATAKKLSVVPIGDAARTYEVRGYLSAIGDTNGTTLVYVWDVVDMRGARLHRVSGQVAGRAASGDPWSGITSETVAAAAARTITAFDDWVND